MRISYSALDTYTTCPQKFKYQEIEKRKALKSKEALFGTAVHDALKFMFSRDPLFPTLEEVLAHFRTALLESSTMPEHEKTRYQESGERMIKNYYSKNPPWNFTVIDLESKFEVVIEDVSRATTHTLVGKIDRIDKPDDHTYEIIDYKTSSKLPSQDIVDNNLQLSLYHLGLKKRWPHIPPESIILSLYYLKAGEKLQTTRTKEALENTETGLLDSLTMLERKTAENDFPPIPSPLCNWCGYKPLCPAWRHLYQKKTQTIQEKVSTESLISEYTQIKKEIQEKEKRLSELSLAINNYLNETGLERLFGDTAIIARKIQERVQYDEEKCREALEPLGIWHHVLAPDQKKLKKLFPTLPVDIQGKLTEAILIKRFTVLSISKKKDT